MEQQAKTTAAAGLARARRQRGFTLAQAIIIVAIIAILSTITAFGISRARASVRLSGSARTLASYLERARADAVRRRAWSRVSRMSTTVYRVEMDLDGDGTMDTRDITLDEGVTFISTWGSVKFDWRGRTSGEISIGLGNTVGTSNINISGAGDITLDSQVFHDASIPAVALNSNVSGDVETASAIGNVNTAVPYPTPDADPTPFPTPTPEPDPTPEDPGTNSNNNSSTNTNTNTNTNLNLNLNTNLNTNTNSNSNSNNAACGISVTSNSLSVLKNGSATIDVTYSNMSVSNIITVTVSNGGQFQVSPTTKTVTGSGVASFTVTVKQQDGWVNFEAKPCSVSRRVNITVTAQ